MLAVGLMSGTSLDGVDAALCEISGNYKKTICKLLAFHTIEIPSDIKEKIKRNCDIEKSSIKEVCELNFEIGDLFCDAVARVCEKGSISTKELDFIASHGQTLYHIPTEKEGVPSTLQIGEPSVLAERFQVRVLSNFREMDMVVGGQGAPLVPYSEYILFGDNQKSIALQNVGGIGNVTYLKKDGDIQDVFAFDTGPGNMMIDEAMSILYNRSYDDGGKIAKSGTIIEILISELKAHDYFKLEPPKSTGRELFGKWFVDDVCSRYKKEKPEDIIATLTYFTAWSIAQSYKEYILKDNDIDDVIVGGGGAHNQTLLTYIQDELPEQNVTTQEAYGNSSDAKEAIAFVVLGNELLHHHFANVKSATGARNSVILGKITPNPYS